MAHEEEHADEALEGGSTEAESPCPRGSPSRAEPRIGEATEELEEIGDPELEAIQDKIIEPTGFKLGATAVLLLVVIASAVFGWLMRASTSTLPPLDERAARELAEEVKAAAKMPDHRRRALVGRALGRAETDRIPGALARALVDGGRESSFVRRERLRRALEDDAVKELWSKLCPDAFDLADVTSRQKSGAQVYRKCNLHEVGLLSPSHVVSSSAEEVLAAHAIVHHLRGHEALTDVEMDALRSLATGTVTAELAPPFQ